MAERPRPGAGGTRGGVGAGERRRAGPLRLDNLVAQLRGLADLLDRHGDRTVDFARLLAARGWPSSTGGGGAHTPGGSGTSGTSGTSSRTERAALNPHPWVGVDERYADQLQLLRSAGLAVQATITSVLAHASGDDPEPAGTGHCRRCERFCRPTPDRPQDRIRSGYCPACYRRWLRQGKPDRSGFERTPDQQN